MDWIYNAIFYQIFPDRFAKSATVFKPSGLQAWDDPPTLSGFKGGDLVGIANRLDHICSMGFNALYLNPIFASTANHRYHTYDYFQVDPILGGNSALEHLLTMASSKGVRVILDGVFNHASRGFYQFNHTLENGLESPYLDWFHFNQEKLRNGQALDAYQVHPDAHRPGGHASHFENVGYDAWWGIPALPKFNTANPQVRKFLLDVAQHWIRFGIDGWRLDVPNEIDDDSFWRTFRHLVKEAKPEAYIVGEIWEEASRWLQGDQFDGVMNYPLTRAILGHYLKNSINHEELSTCGLSDLHPLSCHDFVATLQHLTTTYRSEVLHQQFNILGSHDTPRLLTMASGDLTGVVLSFVFLYLFPGVPCIYYGDEIGMSGGADPDCRRGYEWDSRLWNTTLQTVVKRLNELRQKCPALQRGRFSVRRGEGGEDLVWVCREYLTDKGEHSRVAAVVNGSNVAVTLDALAQKELSAVVPNGGWCLHRFAHSDRVEQYATDLQPELVIGPRSAVILTAGC